MFWFKASVFSRRWRRAEPWRPRRRKWAGSAGESVWKRKGRRKNEGHRFQDVKETHHLCIFTPQNLYFSHDTVQRVCFCFYIVAMYTCHILLLVSHFPSSASNQSLCASFHLGKETVHSPLRNIYFLVGGRSVRIKNYSICHYTMKVRTQWKERWFIMKLHWALYNHDFISFVKMLQCFNCLCLT